MITEKKFNDDLLNIFKGDLSPETSKRIDAQLEFIDRMAAQRKKSEDDYKDHLKKYHLEDVRESMRKCFSIRRQRDHNGNFMKRGTYFEYIRSTCWGGDGSGLLGFLGSLFPVTRTFRWKEEPTDEMIFEATWFYKDTSWK